jgi:TatD DNase family protein
LFEQLELAAELKMPLFLHERAAHESFYRIMKKHRSSLTDGVVHCFTGTVDEVKRYLDMDLHIGYSLILSCE